MSFDRDSVIVRPVGSFFFLSGPSRDLILPFRLEPSDSLPDVLKKLNIFLRNFKHFVGNIRIKGTFTPQAVGKDS